MDATRTVACLIYPDVMSPTSPARCRCSPRPTSSDSAGLPRHYELVLLGTTAGPVVTSAGLKLVADASWAECAPATLDTLLIPGGVGVDAQRRDQALLAWLRAAEPRVRRLGSVCSGALIPPRPGCSTGARRPRTGRTSRRWASTRPSRFRATGCTPTTRPIRRRRTCSAPRVSPPASTGAGPVEADLGRALALAVAQRLVMFLRRPGGQTQFSPMLAAPSGNVARLAALLEWIPWHLGDDLSIEALAAQRI